MLSVCDTCWTIHARRSLWSRERDGESWTTIEFLVWRLAVDLPRRSSEPYIGRSQKTSSRNPLGPNNQSQKQVDPRVWFRGHGYSLGDFTDRYSVSCRSITEDRLIFYVSHPQRFQRFISKPLSFSLRCNIGLCHGRVFATSFDRARLFPAVSRG